MIATFRVKRVQPKGQCGFMNWRSSLLLLAGTTETKFVLYETDKGASGLKQSCVFYLQLKAGETAAVIARELAEQTKRNLQPGDISYTVKAMVQLVDLLDVQLRNLTPGGKDSAARSLNKVSDIRAIGISTKNF